MLWWDFDSVGLSWPAHVDHRRCERFGSLDSNTVSAHVVNESVDGGAVSKFGVFERQLDPRTAGDWTGGERCADIGDRVEIGRDGFAHHDQD